MRSSKIIVLYFLVAATVISQLPVVSADLWDRARVFAEDTVCRWNLFGEQCNRCNVRGAEKAEALLSALRNRVYGQPFVQKLVAERIKSHLKDDSSRKPLTITFFGPSGTGKNYVSQMIAEHVFLLGMQSKFVQFIAAQKLVSENPSSTDLSRVLLKRVQETVSRCSRSLIVIDEANLLPSSTLNSLIALLKPRAQIDGVDYRQSIFLFLVNNEGHLVFDHTYDLEVNKEQSRDSLSYLDYERMLKDALQSADEQAEKNASQEPRGFASSRLLDEDHIDLLVPFLPLRRQDVEGCVGDEVWRRKCRLQYNDSEMRELRQLVADQFLFVPDEKPSYTLNGCKRIETLFDIALQSAPQNLRKCIPIKSKQHSDL